MRDLLGFLLVVVVIFFVVGELRGWYLGVPTQTPILVYKMDHVADTSRRTVMREDMPVGFRGKVRRGQVTVSVLHERSTSFQTGREASPLTTVFERTFRVGETIAIDELFQLGGGVYTVRVAYQDATGLFHMSLPGGSEL